MTAYFVLEVETNSEFSMRGVPRDVVNNIICSTI